MATPLVLAVVAGLYYQDAPQAVAQDKKDKDGPIPETFFTADGVELRGLFHPTTDAKNPKDAPVVVFLYPPGPDRDMTKGDWAPLAKTLNKQGYHVFQFDWRGHGKSTNIKDTKKFWENSFLNGAGNFNSQIKGGPPKAPLKNDLNVTKDLKSPDKFMPAYLMDLAAVRLYLDIKNDKGDLNSSSIFIVGAGDAAALGMAWLTTEWNRPADMPNAGALGGAGGYDFIPQLLVGGIKTEAGGDFAGAVWLTASRPASIREQTIKHWISDTKMAPRLRENNPMLFLYAQNDTKGKTDSDFYYKSVLVAEPPKGSPLNKLEQTFLTPIKGAAQLQGVKLLGEAETTTNIVKFFEAIKKSRANLPWKARDFKSPYFVSLRFFGLTPQP
jgi:pimeloyl-ACP methyl ester carboxylesterase